MGSPLDGSPPRWLVLFFSLPSCLGISLTVLWFGVGFYCLHGRPWGRATESGWAQKEGMFLGAFLFLGVLFLWYVLCRQYSAAISTCSSKTVLFGDPRILSGPFESLGRAVVR